MRKIFINFIGEDILGQRTTSSQYDYFGNGNEGTPDNGNDSFAPIQKILDNGDNKPGQINLPKYDQSSVEKILRFAAPNLGNDDYYPEKTVNPIVGYGEGLRFVGKYPLLSNAALAPAGLWDKRRRAIGDYMLALEQSKSQKVSEPNFEPKFEEGASPLIRSTNNNIVKDLSHLQELGKKMGVQMRDVNKVGHELNPAVNEIIADAKANANIINDTDARIKALKEGNLNLNNAVGKGAMTAMNIWNSISSMPETNPITIGGVTYQGRDQFVSSQAFRDLASTVNKSLDASAGLLSIAKKRTDDIEKKSIEEARATGNPDNYLNILTQKLESKYPIGKDASGNLVMSEDTYLDKIAREAARERPELFQDAELGQYRGQVYDTETGQLKEYEGGEDKSAPYKIEELKNIIASNLGYERSNTMYIAKTGSGSGSASNTVNAAPQYVKGTLEKLNRGEVVQGKSGKSSIISGDYYTTYISDGQIKVVPNNDVVENAKAIAEHGGTNNEYGSVDAPTAIVQMNTGADVDKTYNEFRNARPVDNKRIEINPNDSYQQRFNQSIKSFAGDKGAPIAGGDDIWISKMNSISADKSDSKFFFTLKDKTSNTYTNGVIIPKEKVEASVTNPNAGIWDKYGFGSDKVDMFFPKNQNAAIIDGAYYKKVEEDGTTYYVVYDKKTNSPIEFPGRSKADPSYTVKLPEYYVKNILATPEKLVNEANSKYKEPTSSPNAIQQTTITGVKTKTGGKGQTMTIENKSTEEDKKQKIIKHFTSMVNPATKKNYTPQEAAKWEEWYRTNDKKAYDSFK